MARCRDGGGQTSGSATNYNHIGLSNYGQLSCGFGDGFHDELLLAWN